MFEASNNSIRADRKITFSRINRTRLSFAKPVQIYLSTENFIICVSLFAFLLLPDQNHRSDNGSRRKISPFGKRKEKKSTPIRKIAIMGGEIKLDAKSEERATIMAHCSMMYRHVLKLSTIKAA